MRSQTLEPAEEKIRQRLIDALRRSGIYNRDLRILKLYKHPLSSKHSSLIGVLRLGDGERIKLFCKHGRYKGRSGYEHRGGIAYEAEIYHRILAPLNVSAPPFLGSYVNEFSDEAWIFLVCLENNVKVNMGPQPDALRKAAEWIGSFHRTAESYIKDRSHNFLKSYDYQYYKG